MRKFEKISEEQFKKDFADFDTKYDEIKLPVRKTMYSAGYDFYLPFDIKLEQNQTIKIPTGIKVQMNKDEFLGIYIRGSIGFKYNVRMCNQVGIIDADYYNNNENEGHMFIRIQNEGENKISFKKGDRIAQGIFQKYYIVDDDDDVEETKQGGFGSTNKGDEINE